jgi:hypothetical protein
MSEQLDHEVTDSGSIIMIRPISDAARDWIDENVYSEPWQWMGDSLCIDTRYAGALLYGMQEDGLVSNVTVEPN